MAKQFRTHLMFDGSAEEAMNFYVSIFPDCEITSAQRYEGGENDGKLQQGTFHLGGREFICIDSPVNQDFEFTPAISIFVDCEDTEEIGWAFQALSTDGEIYMPLDDYGFSEQFGWVSDRFGVSWQLNLG